MKKIIKVCGMRNPDNIESLLKLDIDMMGMIFYSKSPRYITEVLDTNLKGNVKKVGVFVNSTLDDIMLKVENFKLDVIQLHGNEDVKMCLDIKNKGLGVIKAFGINEEFDFSTILKFDKACDMFVFDTKTKDYGGSGKRFDWSKLNEYDGETPFLLSGGIGPNHIEEVLNFKHKKYVGVDLNSGFEIEPALKNIGKLEKFVASFKK